MAYRHLNGNIAAGKEIAPPSSVDEGRSPTSPKEPLNILVLGSDSRDGAGNDIDGAGDSGQRADTTILLHVSADRQTPTA